MSDLPFLLEWVEESKPTTLSTSLDIIHSP